MAKDKMVIRDDTILMDYRLIFKAIREEKGNWEQVEKELDALYTSLQEKIK
ncbi:hypothetical protein KKD62_02710 [Patescibacteria group bacterium]|nr:hypothetical protein [Patescibacteria group bacterium]MBU1931851.1 hypothetical protein [Patescibacteria group bacterium]